MIEFLVSNWFIILVIIAALALVGYGVYIFMKRPTSEQLDKVREWLIYATAAAEKELGSGTGQIKLRYVYDMFLSKFPFLVKVIPFELFSKLVDEALDKFKDLLSSNKKVQEYIEQ